MLVSCSQSPKEKANVLIEDNVKKMLYHAETYDPVETVVDSAFAPFDDPQFYNKTLQLIKLEKTVEKYDRKMKDAAFSMSLHIDSYQSAYQRSQFQKDKDRYEKNAENKKDAEEKVMKLSEELKQEIDKGRRFIGFKAWHRFRAQDNAGLTNFGSMEYLFDKDINHILAIYDMEEREYKAVQLTYRQMLGEDISMEEEDLDDGEIIDVDIVDVE